MSRLCIVLQLLGFPFIPLLVFLHRLHIPLYSFHCVVLVLDCFYLYCPRVLMCLLVLHCISHILYSPCPAVCACHPLCISIHFVVCPLSSFVFSDIPCVFYCIFVHLLRIPLYFLASPLSFIILSCMCCISQCKHMQPACFAGLLLFCDALPLLFFRCLLLRAGDTGASAPPSVPTAAAPPVALVVHVASAAATAPAAAAAAI